MKAIDITSNRNRMNINLDMTKMDRQFVMDMIDRLKIHYLAKKVDFDEGIEELGESIKSDWWQKNKHRFIKEDEE